MISIEPVIIKVDVWCFDVVRATSIRSAKGPTIFNRNIRSGSPVYTYNFIVIAARDIGLIAIIPERDMKRIGIELNVNYQIWRV